MWRAARIVDLVAQRDVGQQFVISVDLLDGKDHSLHPTERPKVKPRKKFNFIEYIKLNYSVVAIHGLAR